MNDDPQKLISPEPEGGRDIVASGLGWFGNFANKWADFEISKRQSRDYYRMAQENSRDSVGTTDPRPNVTPDDPRKWFGMDITAPNLRADGASGAARAMPGWGLAAMLMGVLGLGFLFAGVRRK